MAGKRQEQIEHAVRQRLAEALSSAGVGYSRMSLEVLYLLPPDFLNAYTELYFMALKDSSSGPIGDEDSLPIKKTKDSQIPLADNAGKKWREHWQIRDQKAFARKRSIDKELLKLARRMRSGGSLDDPEKRRCNGCGRWAEAKWRHCAWCGKSLETKQGAD